MKVHEFSFQSLSKIFNIHESIFKKINRIFIYPMIHLICIILIETDSFELNKKSKVLKAISIAPYNTSIHVHEIQQKAKHRTIVALKTWLYLQNPYLEGQLTNKSRHSADISNKKSGKGMGNRNIQLHRNRGIYAYNEKVKSISKNTFYSVLQQAFKQITNLSWQKCCHNCKCNSFMTRSQQIASLWFSRFVLKIKRKLSEINTRRYL